MNREEKARVREGEGGPRIEIVMISLGECMYDHSVAAKLIREPRP
jgi:hypothetical protein